MREANSPDAPFSVLLGAVCYLMSRYAAAPDAALARAVSEHLGWLSAHPGCCSLLLAQTFERLQRQWVQLQSRTPERTGGCAASPDPRLH